MRLFAFIRPAAPSAETLAQQSILVRAWYSKEHVGAQDHIAKTLITFPLYATGGSVNPKVLLPGQSS
jgi:hypothetical protein